jgi:hypothetical protein
MVRGIAGGGRIRCVARRRRGSGMLGQRAKSAAAWESVAKRPEWP